MKLCTHIRYRLFQGLKIAALLLSLASCGPGHGRYGQLLAEAEWMNKNDSLFTTDSIMLRVARHYDHWWYSHNTRMKAYYLLGSAYRDLGEAPAAIHYYNMAVERADTLSPDCDYATLFRVYGQMAMVYGFQNMPWEKREAIEHYKHFALLADDTLSSIIAYEQMTDVCYQLDDTLGVYAYTDSASMLYRKYGYEQRAYSCYPTIIFVCVTSRNFSRAAYYMNQFEHKSGLFDESGKIESGRELYYYSKGLYYIGINKTDSAEVYFRRLLPYGYTYEAYKGLLSVYEARNNTDSIVKYVDLFEDAMTWWMGSRQYSEILQSSALYKYERNQHLAEQKARQAQATLYLVLFLFLLLVFIVLLTYQWRRRVRRRNLRQKQEYQKLVKEYQQRCNEFEILQQNLQSNVQSHQLLNDRKHEIERLEAIINGYRNEVLKKEERLNAEDIVETFRQMGKSGYNKKVPTKKEWEQLVRKYKYYMPHVYARMVMVHLTQRELIASILTHMDFPTGDIVTLLDTTMPIVSNAKQSANYKLFGDKSALTLAQNLKKCAYFQ